MAIAGLSGSLLSADALSGAALGRDRVDAPHTRLRSWHRHLAGELGPATSARTLFDCLAVPLFEELGFAIDATTGGSGSQVRASLRANGASRAALIVLGWGQDLAAAWRDAVCHGIALDTRWTLVVNGPALRIIDARRTYSRRYAEFDLERAMEDGQTFATFRALLHAGAFDGDAALDRAVILSEEHRASVRTSLQDGVHDALTELVQAFSRVRRRRQAPADTYEESLVIVYRVLFLLFAEARGLVPRWHPVYRDGYTIESLRPRLERGSPARGLWESLQAIARLAHHGCHAGALVVPAFNGRLFSPAHAPLSDCVALDDDAVGRALLALTTRGGRRGRERIAYSDLGVEQLGGVYERVLDFSPSFENGTATLVPNGARKATGSFYTPRAITEYLVRRTLAPLVRNRPADAILALRVLDPAMGSGAFLVAACRYLAAAYEQALVAECGLLPSDISDADRAGFRRVVAQRCLFGVDINPMAVQLGRLSLWLATLSADRPLTFLDHHLRAGNSLVGASLADLLRQAPGGRHRRRRGLPLFDDAPAEDSLRTVVPARLRIAEEPGDTLAAVREKEKALAALDGGGPLERWRRLADAWCAAWFGAPMPRAVFGALADALLGRPGVLPLDTRTTALEAVASIGARERFFHWTLEFPEVFFDASGAAPRRTGFDAVIGNPPWEVLHGDGGRAAGLTAFTRGSGIYTGQGSGHANLYQLFLERSIALLADEGRLGLILPSGFTSDHGCAALRRQLLDRTAIDSFVSVENRDGFFPIHRSLKFLLFTATKGRPTLALPCRFGVRSLETLDQLADTGIDPQAVPISRAMIETAGGADQLSIPDLRTPIDAAIVGRISATMPSLSDANGWNVRFGRELNASDDRGFFRPLSRRLLPVVEGKLLFPFRVDAGAAQVGIAAADAARLLPSRPFERPRLAYRDVASATNTLTLIAAILPAGVVTTHTLFCLKTPLDEPRQRCLAAMLNSYVANYLVRLHVGTHVTVAILERLPVPIPRDPSFVELGSLARLLSHGDDEQAHARLQALAASAYGLSGPEFGHVLDSFPLVPQARRRAAAAAFAGLVDGI